jgi:hypothetical protein
MNLHYILCFLVFRGKKQQNLFHLGNNECLQNRSALQLFMVYAEEQWIIIRTIITVFTGTTIRKIASRPVSATPMQAPEQRASAKPKWMNWKKGCSSGLTAPDHARACLGVFGLKLDLAQSVRLPA